MSEKIGIMDALKYPFNRLKGMLNFYWMIIPIIGPFIYQGYFVQVVKDLLNGNKQELPVCGEIGENLKKGFVYFLAIMCLMVVNLLVVGAVSFISETAAALVYFLVMILLPVQAIAYIDSEKFLDIFSYKKAATMIVSNLGDFVVVMVKVIVVYMVLAIASIPLITMVVTIPAMMFSAITIMADFYARNRSA